VSIIPETPMTLRSQLIIRGRHMRPIHPGRILKRELGARNLSTNKLALTIRVPSGRITQILNGKRGISAETALRLSRYFGNSARFWMNLQSCYELDLAEQNIGPKIKSEIDVSSLMHPLRLYRPTRDTVLDSRTPNTIRHATESSRDTQKASWYPDHVGMIPPSSGPRL
jgi:antitoxin HigA-1